MGLDMYLKGTRYLSEVFNEGDSERAAVITKQFPELKGMHGYLYESPVTQVVIDVGYWRKANAIHRWFVSICQGGEDNCRAYPVSRAALEELRDICQQVLADRQSASELLPPQSGFLFGSTDVDDFYFRDVEHTVKIVNKALALPKSWDFEYQSSW